MSLDTCCTMWLLLLPPFVALVVLTYLYHYWMNNFDCEFTLAFLEKYGKPLSSLKGQVIWITGASSGLGEQLAYILASHGARLALSGTALDNLQRVKETCLQKGSLSDDDILLVPFNIGDFSVHEACVKKVLDHFNKLDVLVNNAGRSQRAKFQDISPEVDQEMFNINVFGPVNLTRKVLPHFLDRNQGQVVVTSSIAGKMGFPGSATYTGSKHALHGYFETLRSEMCHTNIKVTLVCPGPAFSKIVERAFTSQPGKVHGEKQNPSDKRLTTERCSQLMAVALVNQADEAWMSLQPLLMLYYAAQYLPSIFRKFIIQHYFSPSMAAKLREGR